MKKKIAVITGTRPGLIMMYSLYHELRKNNFNFFVIHTNQHFSKNMDLDIMEDLKIKDVKYRISNSRISKSSITQLSDQIKGLENVFLKEKPYLVVVFGDTNTNLSAALVARKLDIKLMHIEAGERSKNWQQPEEHNRKIIDIISDYLIVTNKNSKKTLINEGINKKNIFICGNPIVDATIENSKKIYKKQSNQKNYKYGILTFHRQEIADNKTFIKQIIEGVSEASLKLKLAKTYFFIHPRTLKNIKKFKLKSFLKKFVIIKPMSSIGYIDFLTYLKNSSIVFTDSGGVQQETVILDIPTIILRDKTEWRSAIIYSRQLISGPNKEKIIKKSNLVFKKKLINKWIFGKPGVSKRIIKIINTVG